MSNNLLKGKKGIIFGALDERSIAWHIAEKCKEQGAVFTLTNAPIALRMGNLDELASKTNSKIIPADVTLTSDMENLISESMKILGGKVDFILHSVGMSPNVRKGRAYPELDYDAYHKTLDISAMSLHRLLQTAMKMDAISEWGSVITLSYIAAQRVFPDYTDMSDAKAMLESIVRGFGYHYGKAKKVRINSVSQSPTRTSAGSGVKGFGAFYNYSDVMSPLGNADAASCADYCVTLFSDMSRMVTMQNLFHDGGFSYTGISKEVMDKFVD